MQYTLKTSARAKYIRITIRPNGAVTVTKPKRVSIHMVEHYIKEKSSWIEEKLRSLPQIQTIQHTKQEISRLKVQALHIAEEKVKFFNAHYVFAYKKISIKNQKTRWGSCSKQGNLNFNYKIAVLPERLADYLVVHELCHLGEFNHSQNFWDLVGEVLPNYKALRAELHGIPL